MITNAILLVQSLYNDVELGLLQATVVDDGVLAMADTITQLDV
jgi:hypothetical protein